MMSSSFQSHDPSVNQSGAIINEAPSVKGLECRWLIDFASALETPMRRQKRRNCKKQRFASDIGKKAGIDIADIRKQGDRNNLIWTQKAPEQ
jgi:hypothetical protein